MIMLNIFRHYKYFSFGKTTFLNALSGYISEDERVITIEDSAELQLQGIRNLVRLETRNSNVEGCSEITIRELIKSSLRMRPDRIVVGEVRGAEAIDMLQCLNTGHGVRGWCRHQPIFFEDYLLYKFHYITDAPQFRRPHA